MQAVHHTGDPREDPNAFEARMSAWVDGQDDVRPEDAATPHGRMLWDTYHLIGDVLRNDSLALQPSAAFHARLAKAIDDEPAIAAPVRWWSWRTVLSGLAVAAAVVMVAWVVLPYVVPNEAVSSQAVLAATGEDGPLGDYLQAHREITGVGAIQRASFGASRP